MELASIYKIISNEVSDNEINTKISFNMDHPVFEGHFPGNPIVPGVVQVQILKDLLEQVLDKRIFLNHTKSIKFLNVINPLEVGVVNFEIKFSPHQLENDISIQCVVKNEKLVYMKYSGNAIVVNFQHKVD